MLEKYTTDDQDSYVVESSLCDFNTMEMEFRMVNHVMAAPDFHEGVRAILLDKDNAPNWQPAALSEVSNEFVESHFENLGSDELFSR